jgi:two-component system sensor histidine kinase AlgZ
MIEEPLRRQTARHCGEATGGGAPLRTPPRGSRRRSLVSAAGLYLLVPAFLTVIFLQNQSGPTLHAVALSYLANLIITLCIGLPITGLCTWVPCRLRADAWPGWARLLTYAGLVILGVAVGGEVALQLLRRLFHLATLANLRLEIYRIGLVVSATIVGARYAYEQLRRRARDVELREESARREALRAQLAALQARTDPHFLYNSLNTVAALIEEDPKLAEQALQKLSALFRYALDGSRLPQVTLGQEVRAVSDYLAFQALRFGDRLRSRIEVDPEASPLAVPPLVLQPLVENAVHHGIAPRREGGCVSVRAWLDGDSLLLEVEDDGKGPGASEHAGSQTSLADLRERLRLLHGDAAALSAGAAVGGGYCVRVRLPRIATP